MELEGVGFDQVGCRSAVQAAEGRQDQGHSGDGQVATPVARFARGGPHGPPRSVFLIWMRTGAVLIVVAACAAGCGSGRPAATAPKTTTRPAAAATTGTELRVGVVWPLDVRVPGTIVVHGKLDTMPAYRLVVVSADADDAAAVAVV